jgi:hypothetical protein
MDSKRCLGFGLKKWFGTHGILISQDLAHREEMQRIVAGSLYDNKLLYLVLNILIKNFLFAVVHMT